MRYHHIVQLDEVNMSPRQLKQFAKSDLAKGIRAGFEAELIFRDALDGESSYDEQEPDYDDDPTCESIRQVINFFGNDDYGFGLSERGQNNLRDRLDEEYIQWSYERASDAFYETQFETVREYIKDNEWDALEEVQNVLEETGTYTAEQIADAMDSPNKIRTLQRSQDDVSAEMEKIRESDAYKLYILGKRKADVLLDTKTEESIESQDRTYENAREEFETYYIENDADEGEWLSQNYRYMSDISEQMDVDWPIWTSGSGDADEGYSENVARTLAASLSEDLGVETKVSSGYHSATRTDDDWIFEPDSSLEADESSDMAVEIISPPMPLEECLKKLSQFFEWAKQNNAYANESTGFHMSVSLPEHDKDKIDFVKLALFLGDEYVLKQFDRMGNYYAKSALDKIRQRAEKGEFNVDEALKSVRNGMTKIATDTMASSEGFGKYFTINPKNNYIEFRSAGNEDYFDDIAKLQNTLMRYSRALQIAGDPDSEKQEYHKKLYKLLSKNQQGDNDLIQIMANYLVDNSGKSITAAQLSPEDRKVFMNELRNTIKQSNQKRAEQKKLKQMEQDAETNPYVWNVKIRNGSASIDLIATGRENAIELALKEWKLNPDNFDDGSFTATPLRPYVAKSREQRDSSDMPELNWNGNYEIYNLNSGTPIYGFNANTPDGALRALSYWRTRVMSPNLDPQKFAVRPNPDAKDSATDIQPLDFTVSFERSAWPGEVRNVSVRGTDEADARTKFLERVSAANINPDTITIHSIEQVDSSQQTEPVQTEPQNFPAARTTGGEFTGRWKIVSGATGEVLHTFTLRSNDQSAANRVAADWARRNSFDNSVEVYPEMG